MLGLCATFELLKLIMSHTLISSPLQGFTDFRFRNAHHKHFGGIDTYYAPYIRLNGKLVIKPGYQKDLQHKNNKVPHLVPQVMTNSIEEFLFVVEYVQSLGYDEINWNLGCPYPMVTNRGLGSGLICNPPKIAAILDAVHSKTDITVSMKMRMGYEHSGEILEAFKILDQYPLKSIGIHARIGKQLYVGGVDLDAFERCVDATRHKLYYNGDITSVKVFRQLRDRFPTIDHWMLGRGLIADPFLPMMIKMDTTEYPEDRWEVFSKYHDRLCTAYAEKVSGDKALIRKMLSYWEYFASALGNEKLIKRLSKTKTLEAYDEEVYSLIRSMEEVAV